MAESLAQKLARRAYLGWIPGSDEELHALAVIGGDKPAAFITVLDDEMDYIHELQLLAKKHGCGTLIHREPMLYDKDGEEGISFFKGMLVYRNEETCKQYTQLIRELYSGQVNVNDYHRRLGKMLGYKDSAIEDFLKNQVKTKSTNDSHAVKALAYVQHKSPPAVYDELAKDPVFSGILSPRKVTQRSPD